MDRLIEERADVVLLDLNMPGMSGFDVLKHLQTNTALADLPVIVLTSAILQPEERASLHGASLILSKSDLASDTLIDAIRSVLRVDAAVGSG